MKRLVLSALVLLACTKARTSEPPSAGSAPAAAAAPSAPSAGSAPAAPSSAPGASATPDAPATMPTPSPNADVGGRVDVELLPAISGSDVFVVGSEQSPAEALNEQLRDLVGGSGTPAKGGRSLVVVKSKTALDTSSLQAGKMAHEYVRKGQASVQRCFEDLRAKDPSARGILTLRFAIDKNGAVVDATVEGFNADVASCVRSAMPKWTFPAPDKKTRFELVLNLVIG